MSYNLELEEKIEQNLSTQSIYSKKKMFGGIAWLLNGNMCFGVHKDFLILRVGSDNANHIANNLGVSEMDITGKAMKGWTKIEFSALQENEDLKKYIELADKFVSSLPSK